MAPLLETLLPKKSQDQTVPRRLVYLDQNVVSSIAKMRLQRSLPKDLAEATAQLYLAIQTTVRDKQDTVCVESMFHRAESSGLVNMARENRVSEAYRLFHEIAEFVTYYSFNLRLYSCSELLRVQTLLAVAFRLGLRGPEEGVHNWRATLTRNPHEAHRVVEFRGHRFVMGVQWHPQTITESSWSENVTRMRAAGEFPSYAMTMERAKSEQRASVVRENEWNSWANRWGESACNRMPRSAVDEFIQSDALFDIPVLYVSRHLYAHVLSERTRTFKSSDSYDIDILSASIPYCDLVVTDSYMAEAALQRGLDTAFGTSIMPATPNGLRRAAEFLMD